MNWLCVRTVLSVVTLVVLAPVGAAGQDAWRTPWGDPVLLRAANGRTDDTITVTERFTRADGDTVHYSFTIEDPTQWARDWSGEFPFVALPSEELLYEYACHEGNYSMTNILGGERELERTAESQQ